MSTAGHLGAIGSATPFAGIQDACFLAYEEKKWGSNAYTLERRRAKDALLSLAWAVRKALDEVLGNLEMGVSDEIPNVSNARKVSAQWVYFTRNEAERAALKPLLSRTDLQAGASLFDISVQHQHACVAFRVGLQGLTIGLDLARKARVDRDNASEKLKNEWAKKRFMELVQALPEGTVAGFGSTVKATSAIDFETLDGWVRDFKESEDAFAIEILIPRGDELLASPDLVDRAASWFALFLPFYQFLSWSRDNDYMQVKDAIQKEVAVEKKRKTTTFDPGARVTIMSGLFAGRAGYIGEVDAKGKAKVMVGPVSVSVDVKDLRSA
ncbi:MAG: hypothetical protein H6729_14150 [Deltaproteobacteria bacterium]|nr:hypothetical protein [Deltaproteobacteria bacterium]